MNKYYVYAHSNEKYGTFYVGKGSAKRLYNTGNRSDFWKRITKKHGYYASILEDELSENDAFIKEAFWIAHFKELNQCIANMTMGGDGVRVDKRWWNEKISSAMKGKNKQFGKESHSYKDFADDDLLKKLYLVDKKSTPEIGRLLGVSYTTVRSRLIQYGIRLRCGKRIICINDGVKFESISGAAKEYGVFRENIRKVLSGKYKSTGGLTFKYED